MNAERLAEIERIAGNIDRDNPARDALNDALDHIAQLEAQRGELARELDLTKREAWTAKERYKDENDRADGLRERLDELNAEEFAKAQRGGAVVVAELTDDDIADAQRGHDVSWRYDAVIEKIAHAIYALAVSRIQPIPASQVLQPGEVGVDRKDVNLAIQWYNAVQDLNHGFLEQDDRDAYTRIRAQQAKGE